MHTNTSNDKSIHFRRATPDNSKTTALNVPHVQGVALVFETSGRNYDPEARTKVLAPFAPVGTPNTEGNSKYFENALLPLCDANAI